MQQRSRIGLDPKDKAESYKIVEARKPLLKYLLASDKWHEDNFNNLKKLSSHVTTIVAFVERADRRRPARSGAAGRLSASEGFRARPAPRPTACRLIDPPRAQHRPWVRRGSDRRPGNGGGPPAPTVCPGGCVRRPARCAAAARQG